MLRSHSHATIGDGSPAQKQRPPFGGLAPLAEALVGYYHSFAARRRDVKNSNFTPAMKLNYYPETVSLYIDLSERDSVKSLEVADRVMLDFDAVGDLVGVDIDHASDKVELNRLVLKGMTDEIERTVS